MSYYVSVDVALGTADLLGHTVDVAVPVLMHLASGTIVWQSDHAVPLSLDDWAERCMEQFTKLRQRVESATHLMEDAVHIDWWLMEPGEDERWPLGLRA